MICPHCGKETARDSAFCAVCGAKIASDVPKLYTRPTDKPNANDSAGSATSASTVTVVVEAPKKEKKKKKLGCFTIFLIVLAVIIGLWIIGSEPQKEDVEAAIVPFQNSEFLNGLLRAELVAHKLSNMEDVEAIQIEKAESYSVTQVERAVNNGSLYLKVVGPFYAVLGILASIRFALQGLGQKMLPLVSSVIEFVGKVIFGLLDNNTLKNKLSGYNLSHKAFSGVAI